MLAVAGIELNVRRLGRVAYAPAFQAMRAFTSRRGPDTPDELWLLEHPPVYTLGQGAASADRPIHAGRPRNSDPARRPRGESPITARRQLVLWLRGWIALELSDGRRSLALAWASVYGRPAYMSRAPRLRRSACAFRAAAAITGSRSMWTAILRRSPRSIPVAFPALRSQARGSSVFAPTPHRSAKSLPTN